MAVKISLITPPATPFEPAIPAATPAARDVAALVAKAAPLPDGGERRCLMSGVQVRAAGNGPGTLSGYTAVFEKFSVDLGGFIEKIARGAFDPVMGDDVRALKNHDPAYLLGRTKSGTLRMAADELGLRIEVDLPDTQTGRDTAVEVGRGDLDGMSFSFHVDADSWDYSGPVPVRTILRFRELFDVGPVTFPAYTDTSAAMRGLSANRPAPPPPIVQVPTSIYQARLRVAAAF